VPIFLRYGERVGAIHFVVSNAAAAANVLSQVKIIVRTNYSSPPCHGARVAGAVLNDPELCPPPTLISAVLFCSLLSTCKCRYAMWTEELAGMARRIHTMRSALVAALHV
jgi:aromatic-amino-acid transaminase